MTTPKIGLRNIPLTSIQTEAPLRLVKAELPRASSSLAAVTYALNGKVEPRRLRLDLGKRVFLDRPENPQFAEQMDTAVVEIVDLIKRDTTEVHVRPLFRLGTKKQNRRLTKAAEIAKVR